MLDLFFQSRLFDLLLVLSPDQKGDESFLWAKLVTAGTMVLSSLVLKLTFLRDVPFEPFARGTYSPGSIEPPLDFNGTNVAKPQIEIVNASKRELNLFFFFFLTARRFSMGDSRALFFCVCSTRLCVQVA